MTMRVLEIEKLQVGMKLGENIFRDEQLVMSQGICVNSRHIQMLTRMNVQQVKILETSPVRVDKNKFKIDLTEKYRNSVEKFKAICHTATVGQIVLYPEVKACLDPLIAELEENPAMAMKLWQIETADFYTYEHSVKVCMLSIMLSKWMQKPEVYMNEIGKTGLLHDMGKCNIPNEILNKPDTLSEEEFSVMKTHSTLGYVLLSSTKELGSNILKGVLHHHERYDGTGYPSKLAGEDIPEYARIITIADVFDAMTSNRIYRDKMNPYRVMEIMHEGGKGSLDPKLTNLFIQHIKYFFVGEQVMLNSGEIAIIHDANTTLPYRPIIDLNGKIIDLTDNGHIEIKSLLMDEINS